MTETASPPLPPDMRPAGETGEDLSLPEMRSVPVANERYVYPQPGSYDRPLTEDEEEEFQAFLGKMVVTSDSLVDMTNRGTFNQKYRNEEGKVQERTLDGAQVAAEMWEGKDGQPGQLHELALQLVAFRDQHPSSYEAMIRNHYKVLQKHASQEGSAVQGLLKAQEKHADATERHRDAKRALKVTETIAKPGELPDPETLRPNPGESDADFAARKFKAQVAYHEAGIIHRAPDPRRSSYRFRGGLPIRVNYGRVADATGWVKGKTGSQLGGFLEPPRTAAHGEAVRRFHEDVASEVLDKEVREVHLRALKGHLGDLAARAEVHVVKSNDRITRFDEILAEAEKLAKMPPADLIERFGDPNAKLEAMNTTLAGALDNIFANNKFGRPEHVEMRTGLNDMAMQIEQIDRELSTPDLSNLRRRELMAMRGYILKPYLEGRYAYEQLSLVADDGESSASVRADKGILIDQHGAGGTILYPGGRYAVLERRGEQPEIRNSYGEVEDLDWASRPQQIEYDLDDGEFVKLDEMRYMQKLAFSEWFFDQGDERATSLALDYTRTLADRLMDRFESKMRVDNVTAEDLAMYNEAARLQYWVNSLRIQPGSNNNIVDRDARIMPDGAISVTEAQFLPSAYIAEDGIDSAMIDVDNGEWMLYPDGKKELYVVDPNDEDNYIRVLAINPDGSEHHYVKTGL